MRFYTKPHQYYCGIDLHAKTMYLCIINAAGETVLHRNIKTQASALAKAVAPYQDDLVISVECLFTWYWIADWCQQKQYRLCVRSCLVHEKRFTVVKRKTTELIQKRSRAYSKQACYRKPIRIRQS